MDRFQFERELFNQGKQSIAGVDEAGRGPLAGPVVVAAVIFPVSWITDGLPVELSGLNDSKALTEKRRSHFFDYLVADAEIVKAIVSVEPSEIDEVNILQATHLGMRRSLEQLGVEVCHALIDGLFVKSIPVEQTAIVKGDSRSNTIAAASVLAKVTRDRLMIEYDREFPGYGFAQHKGYPTRAHLEALRALGPCPIHRRSFAPVRQQQLDLL
ncbi:ribonuclease HII [bacterium]|nr:ribonuclease HII [bacterium]